MKLAQHRYIKWIGILTLLLGVKSNSIAACASYNDPKFATMLHWIHTNEKSNFCKGYYLQPKLQAFNEPVLPFDASTTQILANEGSFSKTKPNILQGPITVIQSGRRLYADQALITRNPQSGQIETIDLYGNVRFYSNGRLLLGHAAHLKLSDNSGYVKNAIYRILLASDTEIKHLTMPHNQKYDALLGLSAWGQAKEIKVHDRTHTTLEQPTYTTCQPNTRQWFLKATKIELNREKNIGHANNIYLNIHNVPVFYWPYLNFPTSKERKTGFLFPLASYTNRSGLEFAWPFYLNLAPNYDAIFAPTVFSKRGLMVKGNFRYLYPLTEGYINFAALPNDKEFKKFQQSALVDYASLPALANLENASANRAFIAWNNNAHFNDHWSSHIDFAKVSDDYYFEDFGDVPELIATNQLLRRGDIQYADEHWNFTGILQRFQTLHQVDRPFITNLYSRLPEFDLNSNYPKLWGIFDVFSHNQWVNFTRLANPGEIQQPIDGNRAIIDPGVRLPYRTASGFFIPAVDFQMSHYGLNQPIPLFNQKEITRTIPTFDIDSGLYFTRSIQLNTTDYEQTLEPRLFYLYVPYHDQSNIPIFDAGMIPFSYNQLFRTNRFSGEDRISDANQIAFALASHLFDQQTGDEKMRFNIGEIYYFHQRRVTLCTTPNCSDYNNNYFGATPENEHLSPIVTEMNYFLNKKWSLNSDTAWDPTLSKMNNANFYFQYRRQNYFLFNFGYNFLLKGNAFNNNLNSDNSHLNQLFVSAVSPITSRWSTMGAINYNLDQKHPQTFLLGFQYDSCCWAARIAGGRTFTTLDQNNHAQFNNGIYFQFELKGLANIDPGNLGSLLTSRIPGYQDLFADNKKFF